MSYCEPALRQYLAAFDGTPKDFSEVEPLFDALYHQDFASTQKLYNKDHHLELSDKYGYEVSTRDEVKEMHADLLSKGSSVTLLHFRKVGLNCIDVEFRLTNEEEDTNSRVIYSIEDGKLASAREVDSFTSIVRARCASDLRLWRVFGKYGTNM